MELRQFWFDNLATEEFLCQSMKEAHGPFAEPAEGEIILKIIIEELSKMSKKKTLIALWVYHLYIGNDLISQHLTNLLYEFGPDLDKDYREFIANPEWPWFTIKELRIRYSQLTNLQQGKAEEDRMQAALEGMQTEMLVPLILYARYQKNYQAVSYLLSYASHKAPFPKLINRLEEMSGHKLPEKFVNLNLQGRLEWLMKRLRVARNIVHLDRLHVGPNEIGYVKELYALQPLNAYVIMALIRIEVIIVDTELRGMYIPSIVIDIRRGL